MTVSPPARKDQLASQRGAMKIVTAFSRRIAVRKGAVENFTQDFDWPRNACRWWIPSSIFVFIQRQFMDCKSHKFESDSKLQRIEESAFPWSALTSIIVPRSVEVL
jgi:hypothetical protein